MNSKEIKIGEERFSGANIKNCLGGVNLDLQEFKINSDIFLNLSNVFGGISIKVPYGVNYSSYFKYRMSPTPAHYPEVISVRFAPINSFPHSPGTYCFKYRMSPTSPPVPSRLLWCPPLNSDIFLNLSNVFGGISIKVPYGVNVKCDSKCKFGGISCTVPEYEGEGVHTIYIEAKITFGGLAVNAALIGRDLAPSDVPANSTHMIYTPLLQRRMPVLGILPRET